MTPDHLADIESATTTARNVIEILALMIGGSWAYLKFFRGRTFAPRAELTIDADLYRFDDDLALRVNVAFRNVGLSVIRMPKHGVGFKVYSLESGRWETGNASWK